MNYRVKTCLIILVLGLSLISLSGKGCPWLPGYNDGDGIITGSSDENSVSINQVLKSHHAEINDNILWVWGYNNFGQLGLGSTTTVTTPIKVNNDTDWVMVTFGYAHTIAIKTDGTLWGWGLNDAGQLGDGAVATETFTPKKTTPTKIGTDIDWATAAATRYYTVAIKTDGTLWGWGDSYWFPYEQYAPYTRLPLPVGTDTNWSSVACGNKHTFALKTDGSLWAFGANGCGQLGIGSSDMERRSTLVQVGDDTNWSSVSAGMRCSGGVKTDGTLWMWGQNNWGQLGNGEGVGTDYILSPTRVGTGTNWAQIAVGGDHMIALKTDGTIWSWGNAGWGQLGLGYRHYLDDLYTPTRIGSDTDWVAVAAGWQYSFGLKSDGTIWAWGINEKGQLGDGTTEPRDTPVQVFGP